MTYPLILKDNKAGLTLIEFIVAFVLTGVMIAGASLTYVHFMDSCSREHSCMETQRQGSYAIGEMEGVIKRGTDFTIDDYGSGNDNKITITSDKGDRIFYQETGEAKNPIKDNLGNTIIPDTHVEGIEVESLQFTDETGGKKKLVRIDLKVKDSEQSYDFTTSVRLRN
ncbi:MAG: prepilin-type N-terminal cleavage/methylation domain-containing protein [Thermodesulfobacteriota bacterium]|nr:prepilin-type N-terminal cleavage/methylation domain-containing protein [Thermodesulfobacteriota bacterium]